MTKLSLPEPLKNLEYTRRKTGLWVPSPLRGVGLSQRGYGARKCCCGEPCECLCEHSLDGTVKCCMNVTIAGMAGSGGDCTEANCLEYNKGYSLYRSYTDDSDNCVWKCGYLLPDPCEATIITATLFKDGSNYKLKVELGGHVWEKNFGSTKPDLCNDNPGELTHQTNSGSCDSSSATCSVAMAEGDGVCQCRQICCADEPTDGFLITFSGVQGGGCWDEYNAAPFVLDIFRPCPAYYPYPSNYCTWWYCNDIGNLGVPICDSLPCNQIPPHYGTLRIEIIGYQRKARVRWSYGYDYPYPYMCSARFTKYNTPIGQPCEVGLISNPYIWGYCQAQWQNATCLVEKL